MKTTLITTVLNEEKNINKFFKSLFSQTVYPDEVVIVDGGSIDKTLEKIEKQIKENKKKIGFKLLIKKGNRSKGRNFAIKNSSNQIILCTDFGCILDKNWVENISEPFLNKKIDVVSGYYEPIAESVFKKCLATYTCVMPDKINEHEFLPSSRSIAFRKKVWEKVKYPEYLDTCEDLVFAAKLREKGHMFKFVKNAIVRWQQKNNFKEAFEQFFNYAKGDGRALFIRPKVPIIYLRYFLSLYLLFLCVIEGSFKGIFIFLLFVLMYFLWSIKKNYKYVRDTKAFLILPTMQVISDQAVLIGTTLGILSRLNLINFKKVINGNKFLILITAFYIILMIFTLDYGIPNKNHPFPYHMDEWHQLQAVRSTFAYGTPNIEGSANGTMLHFILSGLYLIPFTLLGLINPLELKIDDLVSRENIFILLRINTIIWGVLSIVTIYKIADLIKAPKKLTITLFTFTPVWMMLSGYFKYDIALMFWILLALLFIVNFYKKPTNVNYVLAGIPIGLALAVKISVLPLIPIYVLSYFFFHTDRAKNLKYLFYGIIGLFFTALIFGFPDTLFGTGNIYKYFYENLVTFPAATENVRIGINIFVYIFIKHYAIIFGFGLAFLFITSLIFWFYSFLRLGIKKSFVKSKLEIFIIVSFLLFLASLVTLRAYAGGNRALILLPFMVLIISLAWKNLMINSRFKKTAEIMIFFAVLYQITVSFLWIGLRAAESPQEAASKWIIKNISEGTVIGLENIPIYQNIPDILQKEFYFEQYDVNSINKYRYEIVDAKSSKLPKIIVITNDRVEGEILYQSPKEDLLRRIDQGGYKKMKVFRQNTRLLGLSDVDYTVAGLIASPLTITIYIK